MSACEIYAADAEGNVELYGEARNSFGGAMHIWDELAVQYGYVPGDEMGRALLFRQGTMERVWAGIGRMSEGDAWVLASTFDRNVIKAEHLPIYLPHLRAFAARYPHSTLDEEIAILERAAADPNVIAVCWNQTSVNASAWEVWVPDATQEDGGHYRPYNLCSDTDHGVITPEYIAQKRGVA